MTNAEKKMILFLMKEGGCDYCQKCIHFRKKTCGQYISETDHGRECSDDYCIDGIKKYYEQIEARESVYSGYNVHESCGVYNSDGINKSCGVSRCGGIYASQGLNLSIGVRESDGVVASGSVAESKAVVYSDGVIRSYGIHNSDGVYRSNGLSNCFAIFNCVGLSNCLFCSNITCGQYLIFNKRSTLDRIFKVRKEISAFEWAPRFNNANELKGDSPWSETDVSKMAEVDIKTAWSSMPAELKEYIQSLPEYDEEIFNMITGEI